MQQLFFKYFQNRQLKTSGQSVHLCESYGSITDNASNHMVAISFHDTIVFLSRATENFSGMTKTGLEA